MKYSFVLLLISLGVCQGLFGSIGQAVGNLGNTVNELKTGVEGTVNHVENTIGQLLNIVNGVQFSAKFLWETVFNRTFDLMIQGGQSAATSTIPTNPLEGKYAQLTTIFKSNIQHLYSQLFLLEQEAIKAIENGEVNFEERLRSFQQQVDAIKRQLEEWANETKNQLEAHASTIAEDLQPIVSQYKQNIDSTVQTMEKLFEDITKSLVKNFLDFVQSVVPNATNTIENLKNQNLFG